MFEFKKIKSNIPNEPGCYLFKDKDGIVIYVGKAKDLRKRISSYFTKNILDQKTLELVKNISDLDFIITDNEVEAILLESRLIREHQPRYNIILKENLPYAYIKLTDEKFPRLTIARKISGPGKYFGPFPSGKGRRYLLYLTARLFGLKTSGSLSKGGRELYRLLDEARARELDKLTAEEYFQNVKKAELFLRGEKKQILKELKDKMKKASDEENYELAKIYRDQLKSLQIYSEKQRMALPKEYDEDVINYIVSKGKIVIQVFNVSRGVVTSRNDYKIDLNSIEIKEDKILSDFIQQYYFSRHIPEEIIVPIKIKDLKILEKSLTKLKGKKVEIKIPQKGNKLKLLELVKKNILSKIIDNPLVVLKEKLDLPTEPKIIDCFDVSNIRGVFSVGSCVRFKDGKPQKSGYRRFKIKNVKGINDYAMMAEIIERRYKDLEKKNSYFAKATADKEEDPDLIVVDGGKGQLNIAVKVLKKIKFNIPVISLAKRLEEVFIPGKSKPVILQRNSDALKILQNLRNEAHRFAITYHKLLRKKSIK